ncbi:MAG: anti-sigma regulatory factor [Peptoniphilaceae bacterium]|nr:anti-sigma regulatory factor [Peptoniphilaceae bacterium]MDY3738524.1 anti-sigma regulatory factor [Peptoniphilaceae bacterium]
MEEIIVKIPSDTKYLQSVRLFSSSVASSMGFDVESVEDIRVVVSEAVNYKISGEDVLIKYIIEENKLTIEVFGKDRKMDEKILSIRNVILSELVDFVEIGDSEIKLVKKV